MMITMETVTLENTEAKLPLYLFDNDQTYDLLAFSGISSSINSLLIDALGSNSPFSSNWLTINLIDRYTPDSFKWCDNWVTKVYPFIKKLSKTYLLDDSESNGTAYGFEPEYKVNLPNSLDLPVMPRKVIIKVKKGEKAVITWLERIAGNTAPSFVNNSVTEWGKCYREFTAFDDDLNLELDCSNWLFNSVVITGYALLVGLNNAEKELLMYEFLDKTIASVESKLNLPVCTVLTGVTATVNTVIGVFQGCRRFPSYSDNFGTGVGNPILSENIVYSAPVFQQVPDSYYNAVLIYANNNYWKRGTVDPIDTGLKPSIIYDSANDSFKLELLKIFSFFDKYREKNHTVNGYDLSDTLSTQKVIELDIENGLGDNSVISLFTERGNSGAGLSMIQYHNTFRYFSYPSLDKEWGDDGIQQPFTTQSNEQQITISSNTAKKGYKFPLKRTVKNSTVNGTEYLQAWTESTLNEKLPRNSIVFQQHNFNPSGLNYQNNFYSYRTRYDSIAIPFLGNHENHLFESSQVGMIKNGINIQTESHWLIVPDNQGTHLENQVYNRKEITNKIAVIVNVNSQDPQSPIISHSITNNEFTQSFESEDIGDISLQVYQNSSEWNYWNNVMVSQSVNLNRSLRIQSLPSNHYKKIEIDNILNYEAKNDDYIKTAIDSRYELDNA